MTDNEYTPSKPYWFCECCGYENHTKPMPPDRQKFYAKPEPAYKCPNCKSQSLMPVGY